MDLADIRSTVRAASEAGLVAVGEGVATFREALPEQTRIRAEEALGGSSPMRRSMVALVETAAERAEQAARRASERLEEARAEAADPVASGTGVPADVPSHAIDRTASAVIAKEAAVQGSQSRGTFWKMALAVVAVSAAAGAGYAVYAKRRAAAREHLAGEGEWGTQPAGAAGFVPGMADTQSPDVVDEDFGKEVDAVAEELAEEFVEAVEGPPEEESEATPAEHFEPGMADTQSPDVVDDQFAKEVDAAADEIAQDIVDAIEEPKA